MIVQGLQDVLEEITQNLQSARRRLDDLETQIGAGAGGGSGAESFTDLDDVPAAYTGAALDYLRVNSGATAIEFAGPDWPVIQDTPAPVTGKVAMWDSASTIGDAGFDAADVLTTNDVGSIDHNSLLNTHNLTTDIDHGGIDGLGDDDHSIYALLAGRAGGQTLIGALGATGNLLLAGSADLSGDVVVAGDLLPNSNNSYDLGSSLARWANLWFSGDLDIASGTIRVETDDPNVPVAIFEAEVGQIAPVLEVRDSGGVANIRAYDNGDLEVDGTLTVADSTAPEITITKEDVSHPFTALTAADVIGRIARAGSAAGGMNLLSYNSTDLSSMVINAHIGVTSPTNPAMSFRAYKSDGSTGRTALTGTEPAFEFRSDATTLAMIAGGGMVGINATPTTDAQVAITSGAAARNALRLRKATSPTVATLDMDGDFLIDNTYRVIVVDPGDILGSQTLQIDITDTSGINHPHSTRVDISLGRGGGTGIWGYGAGDIQWGSHTSSNGLLRRNGMTFGASGSATGSVTAITGGIRITLGSGFGNTLNRNRISIIDTGVGVGTTVVSVSVV